MDIHVLLAATREVERLLKEGTTGDIYVQALSGVLGIHEDDVTAAQRAALKHAAFGVTYGLSSGKLSGIGSGMDFGSELKARAEKRYAEVMAKREELVCAWLAETGLLPSESVIYYQPSEDRCWVGRKTEEDLTRRMAGYLNQLHRRNEDLLDQLDEVRLARRRQADEDDKLSIRAIARAFIGAVDRAEEEYEYVVDRLQKLQRHAMAQLEDFTQAAGPEVIDLADRLRRQAE